MFLSVVVSPQVIIQDSDILNGIWRATIHPQSLGDLGTFYDYHPDSAN